MISSFISVLLQIDLYSIFLGSFEVKLRWPKLVKLCVSIPLNLSLFSFIWNWELYFCDLVGFIVLVFMNVLHILSCFYAWRMCKG